MRLLKFAVLIAAAAAVSRSQTAVEVVPLVAKKVERTVRLPGEFLPYLKVDLYARVNGFVEKVAVDRGSMVKEGELLVTLSAPELTAQRVEAESKAQAAESRRAEAEAKLAAAESTFERLKAAAATPGAVAGNELVQTGKAVDAARAALASETQSATAAKASVQAIRDLEAYLTVRAPFSGVITERLVHPGALAGPSATPMLRLEQNSRLRLVVAVPEANAGGIALGARVPFTVPAYPGETFHGTVARVAHSVDAKTRTMAVEADVNNASGRLAPGMYPEVMWPVRQAKPALLAPRTAVVTTTERTFVIRVNAGRAEWADVTRGPAQDDLVEIIGPLQPGDKVVRRATDEIRDGSALSVRAH